MSTNMSWNNAVLAAKAASCAYNDGAKAKPKYTEMGYTTHRFLNKDGAACGFCGKTPDQFKNCAEPQHK